MSSDIVTTVTAYGDSIEVRTPKDAPDAQHVHTVKFFDAYNELRLREADRLCGVVASDVADKLRKPVKMGGRVNPTKLRYNKWQAGHTDLWAPALPLVPWSEPKPLSDRDALQRALKLDGKSKLVCGVPVGQISFEEL